VVVATVAVVTAVAAQKMNPNQVDVAVVADATNNLTIEIG
jgi:hypothetical protein